MHRIKKVKKTKNIDETLNKPLSEVYLILDNIRSIHNVGAIFRTADAAGVKKIFLCGITGYPSIKDIKDYDGVVIDNPIQIDASTGEITINYEPSHECFKESLLPRIEKTALLATQDIEWEHRNCVINLLTELKIHGTKIVSLEQSSKSVDYRCFDYPNNIAIVVGNELDGVTPEVLAMSDAVIDIKMHGACKSLNVSTATGIVLFEAIR